MSKTTRQIVREELEIFERVKVRRRQLKSVLVPSVDFAGYPSLPPYIPTVEEITAGILATEKKLKEEFGKDYRKPV